MSNPGDVVNDLAVPSTEQDRARQGKSRPVEVEAEVMQDFAERPRETRKVALRDEDKSNVMSQR